MKLVGRMRNNFLVDSCQLIVDSLIPSPSDSAKSEQKLVRVRLLLLIVGIGIFSSCDKKQTSEKTGIETKSIITAPLFNPDSAYKYVGAQVAFGYRIPNTPAHRKCGDYIIQSLEKYGCKVTVQEFSIKTHDNQLYKLRNIIGSINPQAAKRIIISAHWDTRAKADQDTKGKDLPFDGANDGGSGVAVLLEIARTIGESTAKPSVGIDLIFWDGEDNGDYNVEGSWCLGSQHWAAEKHVSGYNAFYGVNLDMIGGKNAQYAMEGTSMYYAPGIVKKIWDTAVSLGYGNQFVYNQVDNITDDHLYVNTIAKIPMADIIEYENSDGSFFSPSWHTHSDNMEVIDRNSLKAVGQTLLQVVYNE